MDFNKTKILHVGGFFEGSTVNQRFNDLSEIFAECYNFNTEIFFPSYKRGWHSLWRRLCWGPSVWNFNEALREKIKLIRPDIILFDKALFIHPNLLYTFRKAEIKLIHYSTDDQFNPDNQSRFYIKNIPQYDVHITTKSYNVDELISAGARKVVFTNNCTSESFFYPIEITKDDIQNFGGGISFIGTWEKERAESIRYLADNNVKVRIWGPGWTVHENMIHPNIKIEGRFLWGNEYHKAICATEINLNFLRKVNRDLQTTRTIEIPACGAFMLAESSGEHKALFTENEEAVFFSTNEELLSKVLLYQKNIELRKKIAAAGLARCKSSNYYYKNFFFKLFSEHFFSTRK